MEKAKRILFTVSGILSIVGIVLWLVLGIVFIAVANNADTVENMADSADDIEAVKAMFMACGIMFIFFAIMSIVNAILCFKGRNTNAKGVMIINIVFGAISGIEINILAAIFGLIVGSRSSSSSQIE